MVLNAGSVIVCRNFKRSVPVGEGVHCHQVRGPLGMFPIFRGRTRVVDGVQFDLLYGLPVSCSVFRGKPRSTAVESTSTVWVEKPLLVVSKSGVLVALWQA